MSYDQWKTRSPDDDHLGYLCGGQGWDCGNTVSIPCNFCDECLEKRLAEDAMLDFYQWEPLAESGYGRF